MEPDLSTVLGRLRGHAPPPDSVLQRLRDISAHFRVSWTPKVDHRMARWWLHEIRPAGSKSTVMRQSAGRAKLDRISLWNPEAVERRIGEVWAAEAMADGLYHVGDYSDAYFGTDAMFRELFIGQELITRTQAQLRIDAAREAEERSDVEIEANDNPAFSAYVRDVADDWYKQIMGTKHILTSGFATPPTGGN